MDRHVIKGRGENRGKYLCYPRMAGLPPGGDYVWLPEQRKAMRCADPRYNARTYVTEQARKHNGYFVKLVVSPDIRALVDGLQSFIAEHAAGASEKLPCHWFDGDFHDASYEFCLDCAKKLVDEKYAADPKRFVGLYDVFETAEERYDAVIDGGEIDHDSRPYCETCRAKLSGLLSESGADDEIDALTTDPIPSFDDAESWEALDDAIVNLSDDDPRWRRIARTVEAARKEEVAAMPGARTTLLGVFAARTMRAEAVNG
jgi:hypothetical protein